MLVQDTLASFIAEGHLARHVRKMRNVCDHRRSILLAALDDHGARKFEDMPSTSGLHLAARLLGPLRAR